MIASVLALLLGLVALPLLLACGWLALIAWLPARRLPPVSDDGLRFDLIVPAHDEAAGIARTVQSLLALEWPRERFRVLVVADNCSDDTAARAVAAGAVVIERHDVALRGKGPALAYAYTHPSRQGKADAVVVVDADTVADANLLRAFACALAAGAEAMQCRYGVLNVEDSWRTRLMSLALTLVNRLRRRGRDALGGSAGLAGNGMCFSEGLLQRVPHRAHSLAEDLEYGIELGLAGERVWFVDTTAVRADMAAGEAASRSQRARWEGGRLAMARRYLPPLLRLALRGDGLAADLALDLAVPPLSYLALLLGAGTVAALLLAVFAGSAVWLLYLAAIVLLGLHVAGGIAASGLGFKVLIDLGHLPAYVWWKLRHARPVTAGDWVRTERQSHE